MADPGPMTTSTELLRALHDPLNEAIWAEFVGRYRPVLVAVSRRLGLSADDAEDVAQQTLTEFVRDYREGRYRRDRGRLRSWIIGIAKHRVGDVRRRRARAGGGGRGDSALIRIPDDERLTEIWSGECERAIVRRALASLRERTRLAERSIHAFEMVAIEGVPAPAAAEACGLTVDEVYVAKHRVTRRLQQLVEQLRAAWDEAPSGREGTEPPRVRPVRDDDG